MKKLFINPTKEQSKDIKILNVPNLVISLIEKVLRTNEDSFKSLITQDHHTKTFITNVEYRRIPIQDYSGKELKSMQEAIDFYNQVANKIYGKYWMVELLKNEIRYSRDANFGVHTSDSELVQYIKDRLEAADYGMSVLANAAHSTEAVDLDTDKADKQERKQNKKANSNESKRENKDV